MKSKITTALVLMSGISFAQTKNFVIKGKIGTLNAPAKVYLTYSLNDQQMEDSSLLSNGSFSFKGKMDYPVHAMLVLSHDGKNVKQERRADRKSFYLDNAIQFTSADSISKAVLTGSLVNKEDQELQKVLKPAQEKMNKLYTEYASASEETRKSAAFETEMNARNEGIEAEKKKAEREFITAHRKSIVSLYALQELAGPMPDNVDDIKGLYTSLSPAVKTTAMGKKYEAMLAIEEKLAIGKIAPDFTAPDTIGNNVSLSSFRGKYVLLDFWASWCHPCRDENPVLVKAYNKFQPKGFEILSVSLDQQTKKEAWLKAIHDDHLSWMQVSDLKYWKSEIAALYAIRAIPQNFLIDPQGKIIAKNLRGTALETKLAEIFN